MFRKLQPISNSDIGFTSIEIYPDECLGKGAYGAVCKAMCDELPCAAKLLHSAFFQSHDPGMPTMLRRFQQECDLIGRIRHPCIVQYLGTVEDPESHRPILLMELMDESLTMFLEHSNVPLAYHLQVNLSYDIALALAYLHSNGVVHRDLSSNNVLITAGSRAKVTDFGMLKLLEQNMHMTPLTKCPGTVAYMPPEALSDDPVYTDKLDCFSLGVLMIQIITRNFPEPTKATVTVHDPKYPTGRVLVPVPEMERRKKDINLIQVQSPLRTIALECVKDIDTMRPSARVASSQLSSLKRKEEYSESLHKQDDAEHATLRLEMERLKEENAEIKQLNLEKDRESDNLKQQLQKLETISKGSELDDLRQQLCELKIINEEKDAEIEKLRKQLHKWETKVLPLQKLSRTRWTLRWDERVAVSTRRAMWRGAATSVGPLAFFNPGLTGIVYVYDSTTKDWSELPHLVHSGFTLVTVNNLVTAVGGNRELYTPGSILLSFSKGKWVEMFPPMPTKRYFPAAVCTCDMLLVAGGCDCIALPTVEVMDINTLQWTAMASLPIGISSASMAACYEDSIYLLGDDTNRAFSCSVKSLSQFLEKSQPALNLKCQKSIWKRIADVPVSRSTAVTLCGQLVSVGGYDDSGEVDTVYCYDSSTNSWRGVGTLLSCKGLPLATTLPEDKLVVVHGNHENALVGTATVLS